IGRSIEAGESRERRASLGELGADTIEKAIAERAGHSRAAIVRRTAADADHDPMSAARRGREDELASPARARDAWISFARVEERKTARRGHLDHSGEPASKHAPVGIDLARRRF